MLYINYTQEQKNDRAHHTKFCTSWERNPRSVVYQTESLTTRPTGQSNWSECFFYKVHKQRWYDKAICALITIRRLLDQGLKVQHSTAQFTFFEMYILFNLEGEV